MTRQKKRLTKNEPMLRGLSSCSVSQSHLLKKNAQIARAAGISKSKYNNDQEKDEDDRLFFGEKG